MEKLIKIKNTGNIVAVYDDTLAPIARDNKASIERASDVVWTGSGWTIEWKDWTGIEWDGIEYTTRAEAIKAEIETLEKRM